MTLVRLPSSGTRLSPQQRGRVPAFAAVLCLFTGLLDLASALTPADSARLRTVTEIVPGAFTTASAAATLVTGILLIMVAKGLHRRKRRAWRVAVTLLVGSVVLHVLKGLDIEEALVAVALLGTLVVFRDEFYAQGDPRTRWRAAGALLGLLTVSVVLGMLLVLSGADDLATPYHLGKALQQVLFGLVGVPGPLKWAPGHARSDQLVRDGLLALGLLTAVTTAYLFLRPSEPAPHLSPDDEMRMRALLLQYGGRDSLGYFALRRDKSVQWSPSGTSCVAYRVVSGVMLASGDPLGDPGAWPEALEAFLQTARDHAWTPGVMGCSEKAGTAWTKAGLTALEIGDEAVVIVDDFSLEGRSMRNVRQAVARVERAGYTTQISRNKDMTDDDCVRLRTQAAAWRGTDTERGFSMALGRFGDPADDECVMVMAFQEGVMRAFLHFVPWGDDGLSLDLMRRDRAADNGLNELLIVAALRAAPVMGVARLSLNFAVFRSSLERGERLGAGPVLRMWRGVLVFASRWFQIESLYRFNVKFRPDWEPRYVCYPQGRDLPRVALAALEAEAFLVWPRLPWSRTDPPT